MVQCPLGHQFDEIKNKVCPYCGGIPHEINYAENEANKHCRSETSSLRKTIVKCPNGHIYDASDDCECPYCASGKEYLSVPDTMDGIVTKECPEHTFRPKDYSTQDNACVNATMQHFLTADDNGKAVTKQYFTSPGDLS